MPIPRYYFDCDEIYMVGGKKTMSCYKYVIYMVAERACHSVFTVVQILLCMTKIFKHTYTDTPIKMKLEGNCLGCLYTSNASGWTPGNKAKILSLICGCENVTVHVDNYATTTTKKICTSSVDAVHLGASLSKQ